MPTQDELEIIYFSIDGDGAVFGKHFREGQQITSADGSKVWLRENIADDDQVLLETNQPLIAHIKATLASKKYDKAYIISGSTRQDPAIEIYSSRVHWDMPYYCAALRKITKAVNDALADEKDAAIPIPRVELDEYLVVDDISHRPYGYHFDLIAGKDKERDTSWADSCAKTLIDPSKLTLVLMQTHKIAKQHPNANITYQLLDDHYKDLLEPLYLYGLKNAALFPSNVTSFFLHYINNNPVTNSTPALRGEGLVEHDYFNKIRNFYYFYICDLNNSTFQYVTAQNANMLLWPDIKKHPANEHMALAPFRYSVFAMLQMRVQFSPIGQVVTTHTMAAEQEFDRTPSEARKLQIIENMYTLKKVVLRYLQLEKDFANNMDFMRPQLINQFLQDIMPVVDPFYRIVCSTQFPKPPIAKIYKDIIDIANTKQNRAKSVITSAQTPSQGKSTHAI